MSDGTETSDRSAVGPPRVLIADGQPTMRMAARRLLTDDGFEVCAEASGHAAAVEAAIRHRPEICLVDAALDQGGIRTASEIAARVTETAVVVLTGAPHRDEFLDAVRSGAAGYLVKAMDPDRLPRAIRGVLAGEAAMPRALLPALLTDYRTRGRRRAVAARSATAELSRREWEVAELMLEGLSSAQIGARLGRSAVTVRRHTSEIVKKLGVADRAEAIELLRSAGSDPPGLRAFD